MRLLAATAITAAVLTASACGSSDPYGAAPTTDAPTTDEPTTSTPKPVSAAAEQSTRTDVEAYAVQLEQVFFSSSYPKDLAGAVAVAEKLNLSLAPGNRIASYVYDPDTVEFKLCVENTAGAWATYDTRPMTVLKSGGSGGC